MEMWPKIKFQESGMTRTTKTSVCGINTSVSQENLGVYQGSLILEQETVMQDPSLQPSTSQTQYVPSMFMPYIEGSKMDWTINDGLYHRLLKWKLKCKNILDCETCNAS